VGLRQLADEPIDNSLAPVRVPRQFHALLLRARGDGQCATARGAQRLLSYRMGGSFVLYLQERFGLPALLAFFRTSGRDDSLDMIRARFQQAFGATLEEAEAGWLAVLR
jgi:hypothetical protein